MKNKNKISLLAILFIALMFLLLNKGDNKEPVTVEKAAEHISQTASQIDAEEYADSIYRLIDSTEGADIGESDSCSDTVPENSSGGESGELEVHYIDVGQGDAAYICCDGVTMLIDTGDNNCGTKLQLYLNKQDVDTLDYLVLTHPDADHIGGADVVITKFDVGKVYMSDFEKDTATYRDVLDSLTYKGLPWEKPSPGDSFKLGGAECTFIAPNAVYEDPNNASLALIIRNGKNSFLFTGDCEEEAEQDILQNGLSIMADVYQVGHHGSRTSSSEEFLDAVSPEYAVISCAEHNDYGHPHAGTLNKFMERGIQTFRTDIQGTIVAKSDGEKITWNCAPCNDWTPGQ